MSGAHVKHGIYVRYFCKHIGLLSFRFILCSLIFLFFSLFFVLWADILASRKITAFNNIFIVTRLMWFIYVAFKSSYFLKSYCYHMWYLIPMLLYLIHKLITFFDHALLEEYFHILTGKLQWTTKQVYVIPKIKEINSIVAFLTKHFKKIAKSKQFINVEKHRFRNDFDFTGMDWKLKIRIVFPFSWNFKY